MFAHQLIKEGLSRFPMNVGKIQITDQYNQGEMQKYNHGEMQTSLDCGLQSLIHTFEDLRVDYKR